MVFLDILKAALFGVVEGITEWLPVSSTGHMILLDQFASFTTVSENFFSLFEVVIQLGAILAVIMLYFRRLNPFTTSSGHFQIKVPTLNLWGKIIVACLPAAIFGVLLGDKIDSALHKPVPIAVALILVGFAFIWVENRNHGIRPGITKLNQLSYKAAFIIGLFQLVAAIFPGTSRSGATIIGALLIGVARPVAVEFTFMLAIPVMLGASLLKIAKYSSILSGSELFILFIACLVAFVVSMAVIKVLIGYIKRHNFKGFGIYRIVLGIIVLIVLAVKH